MLFLLVLSIIPRAFRWMLLMNDGRRVRFKFIDSLKIMLVGISLNLISPGGSGSILKSYFGYHWTGVKERMISVSFTDKLIAISSLGIFAMVAYSISHKLHNLYVFIFSTILFVLVVKPSIYENLRQIRYLQKWADPIKKRINISSLIKNLDFSTGVIFSTMILSIFAWSIDFLLLYYSFHVTNVNVDLAEVFQHGAILKLGKLFPFTLSGLGSDELIMVFLFASSDSMYSQILIAALIYRLVSMILPALVGISVLSTTRSLSSWNGDPTRD